MTLEQIITKWERKRGTMSDEDVVFGCMKDKYENGIDTELFEFLQEEMLMRYANIQTAFYSGELDDTSYKRRRVTDISKWYADKLYGLGLISQEINENFIKDYATTSLRDERREVPVKTSGLTNDEMERLCNVLCKQSVIFLEKLHTDYGIDKLRQKPDVYSEAIKERL